MDEPALSQAAEYFIRAVGQNMTLTCKACDVANFAIVAALVMDSSTKGEFMQNTLFVL